MGGELHGLEVEVEQANDRMADAFVAGAVEADIVGGPSEAQHGGDIVSSAFPVGEEVAGGGVWVDETGVVHRPARTGQERDVQGTGHPVGREHVVPGVADPDWRVGDGVKDLLDAGRDAGSPGSPPPGSSGWAARAKSNR